MDPTDFPPNSNASKEPTNQPRVQKVTTGEVKTKKKSLRKQFAEAFVGGDVKSTMRYAMFDLLLPEARDLVWSVFSGGFEKWIYGDGRRRSRSQSGSSDSQYQATQYQYNRAYDRGPLMS